MHPENPPCSKKQACHGVPWKGKEEYGLQKSRVACKRGHTVKSDLRKKCDTFLLYSKHKLKNLLMRYTSSAIYARQNNQKWKPE